MSLTVVQQLMKVSWGEKVASHLRFCTLASMRSLRLSTIIGSLVNSSNRYCHSHVSWPNVPLVTKNIPLEHKQATQIDIHIHGYAWGTDRLELNSWVLKPSERGNTNLSRTWLRSVQVSQTLTFWWSWGSRNHWPWREQSICTWQSVRSQFSDQEEGEKKGVEVYMKGVKKRNPRCLNLTKQSMPRSLRSGTKMLLNTSSEGLGTLSLHGPLWDKWILWWRGRVEWNEDCGRVKFIMWTLYSEEEDKRRGGR